MHPRNVILLLPYLTLATVHFGSLAFDISLQGVYIIVAK